MVRWMAHFAVLAVASNADDSWANLQLVMLGLVVIVGAAVLAGGLGLAARKRRHRQLDLLAGVLVLWAAIVVGSVMWYAMSQADWAKQRAIRIESGYGADSGSIDADAPTAPWLLWGGVAIAYVGLATWALLPAAPPAVRREGTTDAH